MGVKIQNCIVLFTMVILVVFFLLDPVDITHPHLSENQHVQSLHGLISGKSTTDDNMESIKNRPPQYDDGYNDYLSKFNRKCIPRNDTNAIKLMLSEYVMCPLTTTTQIEHALIGVASCIVYTQLNKPKTCPEVKGVLLPQILNPETSEKLSNLIYTASASTSSSLRIMFVCEGSDELMDLMSRSSCRCNQRSVLATTQTYITHQPNVAEQMAHLVEVPPTPIMEKAVRELHRGLYNISRIARNDAESVQYAGVQSTMDRKFTINIAPKFGEIIRHVFSSVLPWYVVPTRGPLRGANGGLLLYHTFGDYYPIEHFASNMMVEMHMMVHATASLSLHEVSNAFGRVVRDIRCYHKKDQPINKLTFLVYSDYRIVVDGCLEVELDAEVRKVITED